MSSTAVDTTDAARRNTQRSTPPIRRPHPQDPAVPGPDKFRESTMRASIQQVAYNIVMLNVLTLKALRDGWYSSPQVVGRGRYETFEEFLNDKERDHIDWLMELSDHGFNDHIANYVGRLSHADQLRPITEPRTSCHYSDLLVVCLIRYRAAIAHAALASKVHNLEIPAQYDYCSTYQDYVEQTIVQETVSRHELQKALNCASSLLKSIKLAVDHGSLSDACLSTLKTKLAALQEHYSEAHSELFESPRDLFDPTSKDWWEYRPAAETATEQSTLASSPPPDAVSAYSRKSADVQRGLRVQASLNFIVPIVCLLGCIPIGYAFSYASSAPGTTTNSDFWQLVAGSAMQALSIVTVILPGSPQSKLARISGIYTWLLIVTSALAILFSLVLYRFASTSWSIIVSYIGNAAQVLILLQLTNSI